METVSTDISTSILSYLNQSMDESADLCDSLKAAIDYVVDNSSNVLLHTEKNKLLEDGGILETYSISADVKQSIVNIVQNYGELITIFEHKSPRTPAENREEFSRLIQSYKAFVWKLKAIQDKVNELKVAGSGGNFGLWPEDSDGLEEV